jgi:capsule polysaccharide modification protein KpsS
MRKLSEMPISPLLFLSQEPGENAEIKKKKIHCLLPLSLFLKSYQNEKDRNREKLFSRI